MKLSAQYLAGLFDGEGCVTARKYQYKRLQFPTVDLIVQISMTDEPTIRAVQATCGGNVNPVHWHTRRNNRTAFMWRVQGQKAADFLRSVHPFLITKANQAALGISYQEHLNAWRNRLRSLSADERKAIGEYRESVYLMLRAMKQQQSDFDGMDANSENSPCPVGDDAEGQPRAKLVKLVA